MEAAQGSPNISRQLLGAGVGAGEARACLPWATEDNHTRPRPWSAAHKPVPPGLPAPHMPRGLQRPPWGGAIILHGEVTIRKMGTPEARRPDRVGAYL